MKLTKKYLSISALALFVTIVTTPTYAFESLPFVAVEPESSALRDGASVLPASSPLRAIAAQVNRWDERMPHVSQVEEQEDLAPSEDGSEGKGSVRRLDTQFFDYVMNKHIKRLR